MTKITKNKDLLIKTKIVQRSLYTRIGHFHLRVPQTRDGSFSTEIFKRYQRKEQAFVLGLMEMYLEGVSTRKVANVTEALCGVFFSKSTFSMKP